MEKHQLKYLRCMMKKIASVLFLTLLGFSFQGCAKPNFAYDEEARAKLMRDSKYVIVASFKKTTKLNAKSLIDFVEGRPGFSNKMEEAVIFKVKEFLKGSYAKPEFSIGVNMASIAFGIQPGEYTGQKKFTLYFAYDEKMKRDLLIGAEWEEVKY